MVDRYISKAVIGRLPRYFRYLGELLEMGHERISSDELSKRMKVTASQIRQDLNNFGGFGQQGYGYNVKFLHEEIGKILGVEKKHHVVVVGAGNLGTAIVKYPGFNKRGFKMVGVFDINPKVIGSNISDIPVMSLEEIGEFIVNNDVDIVALTVPKDEVVDIVNMLIELGVRAFWNFSHIDLEVPDHVIVENVHLSDSLLKLSFRLSAMDDSRWKDNI